MKRKVNILFLATGFCLNVNAQVGIGTTSPTQQLHVEGNTRLNGNIYDGSNVPGAAGQVLSSDGTKTQWVNNVNIVPAVSAVFPTTIQNLRWDATAYTGTTLTLPPGKWSVNVTLLLRSGNTTVNGAIGWFRTTFSDTTTSTTPSSDILKSTLASGSITGPSIYGLINGTIIINNTSGASKTYYLWKGNPTLFGTADGTWTLTNFGRGNAEDQIIAFPMN